MTEIEYDRFGNAKILRSFARPSKSSSSKQAQKKVTPKTQSAHTEEVPLF